MLVGVMVSVGGGGGQLCMLSVVGGCLIQSV